MSDLLRLDVYLSIQSLDPAQLHSQTAVNETAEYVTHVE